MLRTILNCEGVSGMTTERTLSQDWNGDPYLQGVAVGLLSSAMGSGERDALTGAVAALRQRGVDVATIYPIARQRYPEAPTLDELDRMPASLAETSSKAR